MSSRKTLAWLSLATTVGCGARPLAPLPDIKGDFTKAQDTYDSIQWPWEGGGKKPPTGSGDADPAGTATDPSGGGDYDPPYNGDGPVSGCCSSQHGAVDYSFGEGGILTPIESGDISAFYPTSDGFVALLGNGHVDRYDDDGANSSPALADPVTAVLVNEDDSLTLATAHQTPTGPVVQIIVDGGQVTSLPAGTAAAANYLVGLPSGQLMAFGTGSDASGKPVVFGAVILNGSPTLTTVGPADVGLAAADSFAPAGAVVAGETVDVALAYHGTAPGGAASASGCILVQFNPLSGSKPTLAGAASFACVANAVQLQSSQQSLLGTVNSIDLFPDSRPFAPPPSGEQIQGFAVVAGDSIVQMAGGNLYGLTPAGDLDWTFGDSGTLAIGAGQQAGGSQPVLGLDGDGRVLVAGNGQIMRIDP